MALPFILKRNWSHPLAPAPAELASKTLLHVSFFFAHIFLACSHPCSRSPLQRHRCDPSGSPATPIAQTKPVPRSHPRRPSSEQPTTPAQRRASARQSARASRGPVPGNTQHHLLAPSLIERIHRAIRVLPRVRRPTAGHPWASLRTGARKRAPSSHVPPPPSPFTVR